jgi:hypothetical protein
MLVGEMDQHAREVRKEPAKGGGWEITGLAHGAALPDAALPLTVEQMKFR